MFDTVSTLIKLRAIECDQNIADHRLQQRKKKKKTFPKHSLLEVFCHIFVLPSR